MLSDLLVCSKVQKKRVFDEQQKSIEDGHRYQHRRRRHHRVAKFRQRLKLSSDKYQRSTLWSPIIHSGRTMVLAWPASQSYAHSCLIRARQPVVLLAFVLKNLRPVKNLKFRLASASRVIIFLTINKCLFCHGSTEIEVLRK